MYRDEHGCYTEAARTFEDDVIRMLRNFWKDGLELGFTPEQIATSFHSCTSELVCEYYIKKHAEARPPKPMVGVFWYAEESFYKSAREVMEIALSVGDPYDHLGINPNDLIQRIPENESYFYKEGKSGKVVYNTVTHKYEVHGDERLLADITFQRLVVEEFHLPPESTEFIEDVIL